MPHRRRGRMKRKSRCNFCLKTDREYYISGPEQNKRRAHICSKCVEECTYILLENEYEKVKEEDQDE
jgi:hypothetical protein